MIVRIDRKLDAAPYDDEPDDDDYDGMNIDDLTFTNVDDDSAGVMVTAAANLQTTEEGGTATFDVVLASQPSANVTARARASVTAWRSGPSSRPSS